MEHEFSFSAPGQKPTPFEVHLLQQACGESEWVAVAQRLIASLGPELGSLAFLVVLDELPSTKIHVPMRQSFMRILARPEKIRRAREMLSERVPHAEVGKRLKCSPQWISKNLPGYGRATRNRRKRG